MNFLILLYLLKWPSLIQRISPSFTTELSTTPLNMLLNIQEDSTSSKIWKRNERISQNSSSIIFFYLDVFILTKPKKFSSPSPLFQPMNHPKNRKSTIEYSRKSNIFMNLYGDVKQHSQLHCCQLCWSPAQPKAQFWVSFCSVSPRSWVVGSVTLWPTTDIHFLWSTVELLELLQEVSVCNGGAPSTTCITFSQTASFTMMTLSTTTRYTCTNSCIWNGDLTHWSVQS